MTSNTVSLYAVHGCCLQDRVGDVLDNEFDVVRSITDDEEVFVTDEVPAFRQ